MSSRRWSHVVVDFITGFATAGGLLLLSTGWEIVWLSFTNVLLNGSWRKLTPCYISLYSVVKIIHPVAVKQDLPRTLCVYTMFHKLKPSTQLQYPLLHVASWMKLPASRRVGQDSPCLVDWEGDGSVGSTAWTGA